MRAPTRSPGTPSRRSSWSPGTPSRRSSWLVLAALVLFAPATAYAQASIAGTVKDTSGAVLPGVTVEASSDVLIERVRTVVTDGNGRFQLVDLRPGAYVVTFALPGFNTFRRDGVTLAGSGTVTVDAELRVGSIEETVTVTSEAPTVDVQSTTRQSVLDNEAIAALPTSRNYATLARLIPGTSSNVNDVGGSAIQDVGGSTTIHGSRNQDQRVTLNGINTMTLQAGGNIGGQIPDVGSAAEITVDTSSLSAELPTGGVRINFIPRDGGNRFSNSTFVTFSNSSLQGNNFSEELRAAGLATPSRVEKNFDINESLGGPIQRDRVWFWFSTRYNLAETRAPVFANKNAFDPTKWLYEPDPDRPGINKGRVQQNSVRVTWQASPKHKIAGTYKADTWCNCPNNISATVSPEAGRDRRFPRLRQEHLEWTSPLTNRVLLEAVGMHLYERWGNMHLRMKGGSLEDAAQEAAVPLMISVVEQSTNMTYRAQNTFNNTSVPNFAYRAAMSYVTGTHNVKVGFNRTHGYQVTRTYNFQPYQYRFNNGVPNQVTIYATPYQVRNHEDNDLGFYAQDRWSLDRVTVGMAIRYDYFATSFPEQQLGPGLLLPNRNVTFAAQDNTAWKDLTYRTGLSYDIFGTGKTALKLTANKYLLGQTLNALGGADTNPINALITSTNRPWTDSNRDYVPNCVLTLPEANGECGPLADRNFGTAVPGATFDKDLLTGWGNRMSNWEFSVGVQHEVLPRVSVDVAYFRRIWSNFRVTDNLALGPTDFDQFSLTAPSDPRLPDGGGYTVEGLYNVKPEAFTRPAQNLNTLSDKYGTQIEHWNGFDITLNARLQNGLTFQAGTSTGKTLADNCDIVAKLPELNLATANSATFPVSSTNSWQPAGFCRQESPFQTQLKMFGVYTIPRIDVQIAGTFRNTPGAPINANFVATNAYLAANSTLGRPLAGGVANMTVGLLSPDQTTEYLKGRNELDLRFGKIVRVGRARSVVSVDVFNALNSDALISVNQAFASWLRPTEILNPRMVKFSMQFDF
jgi:hypothetical protein